MHLELLVKRGAFIPEPSIVNVEIKPEDFEDVDYFVVQQIEVNLPICKQTGEAVRAA
jgi:hypothetical protein